MKKRNLEDEVQKAYMQYMAMQYPLAYSLTFAVPNGEDRPKKIGRNGKTYCPSGQRLKEIGVKEGVPDTFTLLPRGGYHGFVLELKSKTGTVRPEQREWLQKLEDAGYRVSVAKGLDAAIKVIDEYMGL